MKTPNLLDVPKTHPGRKDRVKAFKARHGIFTHNDGFYSRETPDYEPWSALAVKHSRERFKSITETDPVEIIAGWCSRLDECGLLVTGKTEADAIRTLCQNINIHCDL